MLLVPRRLLNIASVFFILRSSLSSIEIGLDVACGMSSPPFLYFRTIEPATGLSMIWHEVNDALEKPAFSKVNTADLLPLC